MQLLCRTTVFHRALTQQSQGSPSAPQAPGPQLACARSLSSPIMAASWPCRPTLPRMLFSTAAVRQRLQGAVVWVAAAVEGEACSQ